MCLQSRCSIAKNQLRLQREADGYNITALTETRIAVGTERAGEGYSLKCNLVRRLLKLMNSVARIAYSAGAHRRREIFVNVVNIHAYLSAAERIKFSKKLCIYVTITRTRIRRDVYEAPAN
jgi:hypothetical protein